jgi:hypothetical protein
VSAVPSVLTDADLTATGAWTTGDTGGGRAGHQHRGPGPSSGPQLPHVGGHLPPGSVTDPTQSGTNDDVATATEVHHTIHDLTGGLTDGTQNTLGSAVADTTHNVLDAVGQVGNTVTGAIGDTVGGLESALPSDLTSHLPALP